MQCQMGRRRKIGMDGIGFDARVRQSARGHSGLRNNYAAVAKMKIRGGEHSSINNTSHDGTRG